MAGNELKKLVYSEVDLYENSELKNQVFVYQWSIKNFVTYLDRKYELSSRTFCNYQGGESKWKMMLYPKHIYPFGAMLAACLVNMSENEKTYGVKYTLWIVTSKGLKTMYTREKMFKKHLDFDDSILASHKDLVNENLLQNGNLVIRCEMDLLVDEISVDQLMKYCLSVPSKNNDCMDVNLFPGNKSCDLPNKIAVKPSEYKINNNLDQPNNIAVKPSKSKINNNLDQPNNIAVKPSESKIDNNLDQQTNVEEQRSYLKLEKSSPEFKGNFSSLSNDFEKLYESKTFADVILRCKDSELVAHKYVLAARSDYFRRILNSENGMDNNVIEILDVTSHVMEVCLYYMYTDKLCGMCLNFALDVLPAAEKFNMPYFQESLMDYFSKNITVENVTEVFQVSVNLNIDELKKVCFRFIDAHGNDVKIQNPGNE